MARPTSSVKEVLHLLFPMILTMTLELSTSVVDTIMLGHYGSSHLAAVGLAASLWLPVGCFLIGITFGITPLVTRHLHGRQRKLVDLYMSQAVGLTTSFGVMALLVTVLLLPWCAKWMAGSQETGSLAVSYLYIFAPALPMLAMMTAYKNLFEAAGRPHVPLLVVTLGLLLNVVLNYVFIYGHFGFPEWGVKGAALSSAISLYFDVALFVFYDRLSKKPLFSNFSWRYFRKFSVLLHVGAPAGFAFAFEVGLFSSLTWLISSFGDVAIGAGQIIMSYTSLLFTPMMAMSAVTAIVVAKAMSQEGISGVRERIRIILLLGVGYVGVCFMLTQTFREQIPYLYTSDEGIAALTTGILMISSCYQLPDMLQTVFTGALRGFRDTRSSMIAFAVSLFGLSMPLGYWLSHYSPWADVLTVRGFYLGLAAGLSLLAVILIMRYRMILNQNQGRRIASPDEVA